MIDRRNFLKLGALFVPAAVVEPRRVYSFLWEPSARDFELFEYDVFMRTLAAAVGLPEHIMFGDRRIHVMYGLAQ